jgi:prolyl oligopeptidase
MTASELDRLTYPPYPPAPRVDVVDHWHGHDVADPYRWLEEADDPQTRAWSAAQDELYASVGETWPGREAYRARLAELHAVGEVHAPIWRRDLAFTLRRGPSQDHAVLEVIVPDRVARALIDPIAIDPSGATTLDFWVPSPDGSRLAYGMSEGGTEQAQIRVMDVATGMIIDGPIDRVRYTPIAWLPDGEAYYYVRSLADEDAPDGDDGDLYRRVYRHAVGTDPASDPLVFGADAPRTTFFWVWVSDDGRWVMISQRRGTDARNDLWIADRINDRDAAPRFVPVQVGIDAETDVHFGRDGLVYLLTKRGAPRWRLCVAEPGSLYEAGSDAVEGGRTDPGTGEWREVIPEDPTAVISHYAILDGAALDRPRLALVRTRHAVGEVSLHDLETGELTGVVQLPGVGTVDELTARHEGGHEAWLTYTDFTTPVQVLRVDAATGALDRWAQPPGTATTSVAIVTRHVQYPSYDGIDIGMFVAGSTAPGSGPVPTILYGYGGFNISRPPVYDPWILAWIEAGGVFALASLRGGGEEGEAWHRDGMRAKKQNVFDDFHAAADWLVAQGVTTYEQLGIFGGSNGGLLVGAALTQHPEKYAAVVCSAPLLDMVRYENFGLGALWHGEYGTAAEPEQFAWLYAYSPYHHVSDGAAYPAVVFTVFEGDSRVDPLHARKLCAALQNATSSGRPVVIRREQNVGHASRAVSRTVELAADRLAFFTAYLPASVVVDPGPHDRSG